MATAQDFIEKVKRSGSMSVGRLRMAATLTPTGTEEERRLEEELWQQAVKEFSSGSTNRSLEMVPTVFLPARNVHHPKLKAHEPTILSDISLSLLNSAAGYTWQKKSYSPSVVLNACKVFAKALPSLMENMEIVSDMLNPSFLEANFNNGPLPNHDIIFNRYFKDIFEQILASEAAIVSEIKDFYLTPRPDRAVSLSTMQEAAHLTRCLTLAGIESAVQRKKRAGENHGEENNGTTSRQSVNGKPLDLYDDRGVVHQEGRVFSEYMNLSQFGRSSTFAQNMYPSHIDNKSFVDFLSTRINLPQSANLAYRLASSIKWTLEDFQKKYGLTAEAHHRIQPYIMYQLAKDLDFRAEYGVMGAYVPTVHPRLHAVVNESLFLTPDDKILLKEASSLVSDSLSVLSEHFAVKEKKEYGTKTYLPKKEAILLFAETLTGEIFKNISLSENKDVSLKAWRSAAHWMKLLGLPGGVEHMRFDAEVTLASSKTMKITLASNKTMKSLRNQAMIVRNLIDKCEIFEHMWDSSLGDEAMRLLRGDDVVPQNSAEPINIKTCLDTVKQRILLGAIQQSSNKEEDASFWDHSDPSWAKNTQNLVKFYFGEAFKELRDIFSSSDPSRKMEEYNALLHLEISGIKTKTLSAFPQNPEIAKSLRSRHLINNVRESVEDFVRPLAYPPAPSQSLSRSTLSSSSETNPSRPDTPKWK